MPIVVLKGGPLDNQQFNYSTDGEVPDSIYCLDPDQHSGDGLMSKLRYRIELYRTGVYYGFINKEQYYADHRTRS